MRLSPGTTVAEIKQEIFIKMAHDAKLYVLNALGYYSGTADVIKDATAGKRRMLRAF